LQTKSEKGGGSEAQRLLHEKHPDVIGELRGGCDWLDGWL